MSNTARMGILVGGGPAPGINSAIGAAVIEAVNSGLSVVGILDGYKHLAEGRTDMVRPLGISDVSRIHSQGGSILRTSRTNPARNPEDLRRTVESLGTLGIEYLVTIGGDDTAFGASEIAKAAGTSGNRLKVAHVPKTIDNDLPLPGGQPTFGFETVRQVGTEAVLNLMEEARTTNRWYFIVVMGREAGHLALGIAKAAGATLALIPEEFPEGGPTLDQVSKILEGAILKRRVMGHEHGVAVIAEGIADAIDMNKVDPGVIASLLRRDVTGAVMHGVGKAINEAQGMPPSVIERISKILLETSPQGARDLLTVGNEKMTRSDQLRAKVVAALLNSGAAGAGRL